MIEAAVACLEIMLYLGASHNVSHDIQALHFFGTYLFGTLHEELCFWERDKPRDGSELEHIQSWAFLFCQSPFYVPNGQNSQCYFTT